MDVVMYHNPRCSKSRGTLALLQEHGVQPEVVNYLETPLDAAALLEICRLLGISADALVRFKESVAVELGLAPGDSRTQEAWCELIAAHPILMERPIVVVDGVRAAIGRPPEAVLKIVG